MPAAGEINRLKKWRLPAGFLAGDESVKHNGHFNPSLSRLNLIFSRQPNFLATTLQYDEGATSLGLTFWPYNKFFIDQACSVKMAGYWPRYFFFEFLWTSRP